MYRFPVQTIRPIYFRKLATANPTIWWAPAIGAAASAVGNAIMWATELQPFFMGIIVSVIVGIAPIAGAHQIESATPTKMVTS